MKKDQHMPETYLPGDTGAAAYSGTHQKQKDHPGRTCRKGFFMLSFFQNFY